MRRTSAPRLAGALLALLAPLAGAAPSGYARIDGARFESVMKPAPDAREVVLAPFLIQRAPVTNGEFQRFVTAHSKWRRGSVPALFADAGYLRHWSGPLSPGPAAAAEHPVVNVSWFAATAYCEAQGSRLPTWHEWEWVAAADEKVPDARQDPAWRQRILGWYSRTGSGLRPVAQERPNVHGVHDLHGLVWEWVEDHGAMMVSADNREQGDPDLMRFCGTGALSMEQREHYAVLMRIALLSSLEASQGTATLGFRCARDAGATP